MFRIKKFNINNQYIKYKLPFTKSTYLIKWFPKSKSNIHSHNGKECDFVPLWGDLLEVRYKNRIGKSKKIKQLHLSHINDSKGKHQVFNNDNYKKWSIHRYYI